MARENLRIGDWVDVNGNIEYKFMKNSNDKLRQSGYILGKSVFKSNKIE